MNIGPIGSLNSINSVWDNYCKKICPSQNVRKASEVGLPAQSFADIFAEELRKNYKLYFSVKAKYRRNGKWLMNDKTALALRTLKDKDGNYLWNQADNTILGKEVLISEFMPDEGTPILFGDFKFYRIIDRCKLNIRVLKELFAAEDKIGYLGYAFMDGVLTKREAIKSLHLA